MRSLSPLSSFRPFRTSRSTALAVCAAALLCSGCGGTPGGLSTGGGSDSGGTTRELVIDGLVSDSPNPSTSLSDFPADNAQTADGPDDDGAQLSTTLEVDPGPSLGTTTRAEASSSVTLQNVNQVAVSLGLTNVNAFQVISKLGGRRLQTERLQDPSENTVLSADDNDPPKTLALGIDTDVNALSYPTSTNDPAVVQGVYVQTLVTDSGDADAVEVTIKAKNDPNLSGGVLRVNIFFVGTEANEGANQTAVRQAVEQWRSIYAAAGITLTVKEIELRNESGNLPVPFFGDSFYSRYSADSRTFDNSANVFIGEEIVGGTDLDSVLGISGGIPGAFVSTRKSGIAISLSEIQGADGALNDNDTGVLAETIAHEVGHYLGLFHPVEVAVVGDGYTGEDSLDDTPRCSTTDECVSSGTVNNLMFPVSFRGAVSQRAISEKQRGVLNLQVIVD